MFIVKFLNYFPLSAFSKFKGILQSLIYWSQKFDSWYHKGIL